MKLYIVRHGQALEATEHPSRPLSEPGKQAIETLGKWMSMQPMSDLQILHSDKARAVQTAEIIANHIGAPCNSHPSLQPNDSLDPILSLIHAENKNTMIVGHLPYVELLAKALTGATIQFKPGQCLCLEGARDLWQIQWLVDPTLVQS